MATPKLNEIAAIAGHTAEIFSVKYSPEGDLLAAACSDGVIRIFCTTTHKVLYTLHQHAASSSSSIELPVTCLRWRPVTEHTKTKNILLAVGSDGSVYHWHATSGKCLHRIEEENNQIYAVDYSPDGTLFATAGRDLKVRVYDEATKSLKLTLSGGLAPVTAGHSSRIFSIKFHPSDPNIILTGGWDNTIQMWDMRVDYSVRSVYGPHICGEALDINGTTILSGSWRPDEQLQLWDYTTATLTKTIEWPVDSVSRGPCMVYAAEFSPSGRHILAGGSGSNEARLFTRDGETIAATSYARGVYAINFAPDGKSAVIAVGDGTIHIISI